MRRLRPALPAALTPSSAALLRLPPRNTAVVELSSPLVRLGKTGLTVSPVSAVRVEVKGGPLPDGPNTDNAHTYGQSKVYFLFRTAYRAGH